MLIRLELVLIFLCFVFFDGLQSSHSLFSSCLTETNIAKNEINLLLKYNEQAQKFLCARKCMHEKVGEIKADGTLDVEKILKNTETNPEMSAFKECLNKIDKIESCEDTKKIASCWPKTQFDRPEIKTCLSTNKLDEKQYATGFLSPEKSQEFLCAFKCISQDTKDINADGTLNIEKLTATVDPSKPSVKKLKECLEKIGKLQSCDDMKKLLDCSSRGPLTNPKVNSCLTKYKLNSIDYLASFGIHEKTQDFLCTYKCIAEKVGKVQADGKLDVEDIENTRHMPEDRFTQFVECLKKIGKIKSCDDMKKTFDCLPEGYSYENFHHLHEFGKE